jgi:hypothetical protein
MPLAEQALVAGRPFGRSDRSVQTLGVAAGFGRRLAERGRMHARELKPVRCGFGGFRLRRWHCESKLAANLEWNGAYSGSDQNLSPTISSLFAQSASARSGSSA